MRFCRKINTMDKIERYARTVLPELMPSVPARFERFGIILAGTPGSGKSYFSREIVSRTGAVILSTDTIRIVNDMGPADRDAFTVQRWLTHYFMNIGHPIILDANYSQPFQRREQHNILRNSGARSFLVWIDTPADIRKERLALRAKQAETDPAWTKKNLAYIIPPAIIEKQIRSFKPFTEFETQFGYRLDGTAPFLPQGQSLLDEINTLSK